MEKLVLIFERIARAVQSIANGFSPSPSPSPTPTPEPTPTPIPSEVIYLHTDGMWSLGEVVDFVELVKAHMAGTRIIVLQEFTEDGMVQRLACPVIQSSLLTVGEDEFGVIETVRGELVHYFMDDFIIPAEGCTGLKIGFVNSAGVEITDISYEYDPEYHSEDFELSAEYNSEDGGIYLTVPENHHGMAKGRVVITFADLGGEETIHSDIEQEGAE